MLGDKFYIEIENDKVQINEPFDFSQVDFSITQDKDYFYRRLSVAGNKTDLRFVKNQHKNVFDDIVRQFEVSGFNAEVYFWYNDVRMRLSFATAETNYLDYFKCQAINDTIIDILNDNKDVKVDLLSDKDIYENDSESVVLKRTYASSMGISRRSEWRTEKEITIGTSTNRKALFLNTIGNIKQSDIKNTYAAPVDFVRRDWDSWWVRKQYQFLGFADNYKNVTIKVKIKGTYRISGGNLNEDARLTLFIGNESLEDRAWYDNAIKHTVTSVNRSSGTYNVDVEKTYTIESAERGMGIWMCWENHLQEGTQISKECSFHDVGSSLEVVGTSYAFGSIIQTDTYENCVNNLVKKIVPQAKVVFNVDKNLQANNLLFSGNQIRFENDKPFILMWKDVTEQLKEYGLGYRVNGNNVIIDNIKSFYNEEEIHHFDKIDSSSFKISQDDKYNINILNYSYKKFQALKENSIEGNAGTTNGSSQWYVQNKFTENSLTIDLPISRDKYMLEDTRIKSLAYNENTSTSDDNTLYLFGSQKGTVVVNETAFLRSRFDEESQRQSFSIRDNEFSWIRIGVAQGALINFSIVNDFREYLVTEISDTTLICTRVNHTEISNYEGSFRFNFNANVDYNINVGNANDSRSIKQNLLKIGLYLSTYNYHNWQDIYNREYKENGNFSYNGVVENEPLPKYIGGRISPKIIEFKAKDSFKTFKKLSDNVDKMCSVLSPRYPGTEIINFFIKEVTLKNNASNCNEADFTIKGQIYDN